MAGKGTSKYTINRYYVVWTLSNPNESLVLISAGKIGKITKETEAEDYLKWPSSYLVKEWSKNIFQYYKHPTKRCVLYNFAISLLCGRWEHDCRFSLSRSNVSKFQLKVNNPEQNCSVQASHHA